MIQIVAFTLIGAFINRVRGGFLPTGHTQIARAIYAAAFSGMVLIATGQWLLAMLCLPAWFFGAMAPNDWGQVRSPGEVFQGAVSGVLNVVGVFTLLVAFGHPVGVLLLGVGIAKGRLYWLAVHKIPSRVPHLQGGEIGEALFGAALGLVIGALA